MICRIVVIVLLAMSQSTWGSGQINYSFDREQYQQLKQRLLERHSQKRLSDDYQWVYIYLLDDQNHPTSYYIGSHPQRVTNRRYRFVERRSHEKVVLENVTLMITQQPLNVDAQRLFVQRNRIHAP